ncbi:MULTISPECIES: hypothetical protein [unclassified Methylobacterium]|jgi:hypothetical protein|uniref:hypothetical protein n=1 Tax=unclassified Methylobacterium TaxID=2615210 RepID=UPI001FEED037|nr:hypothetical protein [Methylobacterium sp. 2A]
MRIPLLKRCPRASIRREDARRDTGLEGLPGRTRPAALIGLCAALVLAPVPAGAGPVADPDDPHALEQAWHRCLREASGHQPPGQSRAGDERNALDECKPREDALVAALMSGRRAEDGRTGTVWARTWAAFVEPLTAWIGGLRR